MQQLPAENRCGRNRRFGSSLMFSLVHGFTLKKKIQHIFLTFLPSCFMFLIKYLY